MPKFVIIFDPRTDADVDNILNSADCSKELPEGVLRISKSAFLVDFPKCDLFLAKILVSADDRKIPHTMYQVAPDEA